MDTGTMQGPIKGGGAERPLRDLTCPYCVLRSITVETHTGDEAPGFECSACYAEWSPDGSAVSGPKASTW